MSAATETTRAWRRHPVPDDELTYEPSERWVRGRVGDVDVVDSRRPTLIRTDLRTGCPYKGTAEYWSFAGEADVTANIAWSYAVPLPAVGEIEGLVAFYNEVVDITVDGVALDRPVTDFTRRLTA